MYKISCDGKDIGKEFDGLVAAMEYAKNLSGFISITGDGYEVVGKFGVDSVVDQKLPDGSDYTWRMRRDENHRSWRKKNM